MCAMETIPHYERDSCEELQTILDKVMKESEKNGCQLIAEGRMPGEHQKVKHTRLQN